MDRKIFSRPTYFILKCFVAAMIKPRLGTYWTRIFGFHCLVLALWSSQATTKELPSNRVAALYASHRLHPELFRDLFLKSWLHPDFLEIFGLFQVTPESLNPSNISHLLKEEAFEVYSFPCFSNDFLETFNSELVNFYRVIRKHNVTVKRPNSMNHHGVIMAEFGMDGILSSLQQQYIWPLARRLFPVPGKSLDEHYSFIVRYQPGEDLGLDMHIDDSDVTFNVCLGEEGFSGATLAFCGTYGEPDHRHLSHVYQHQVGRAILHLGTRRHGAEDITSGTRSNLIVWNYNSAYRRSSQYKSRRFPHRYQKESHPPDPICLSHTHDRDYTKYKELSEAQKEEHFDPWCPPVGKEYDGFYDDADFETVKNHDEL